MPSDLIPLSATSPHLEHLQDSDSLSSLCQTITTVFEKKFFLMSNLNPPATTEGRYIKNFKLRDREEQAANKR